ncbi:MULTISPECIES: hypothetical protein [Pseudomonas]|jgi:hypothetical protein|uniref:hypothetical protein n=2 Tax=Pseudomonas TaxID=286 RepID=UPI0003575EC6|nr:MULTISPECIES: hypothetical protein [Pseudomonas]OKP67342.1 hypothetical protein BTR19_23915 [Pseudomonas fluorescens]EPJ80508.1 hypothetical protein CFT9_21783 [Pseudomonas sp. CFT9]EPL09653.1 hypothetical protein CF150_17833 [Pseudomonas sp. CF150]MCF5517468.1 hypothetical protein [Pseudomonas sp. PA-3-6E]MCF5564212.1 hypothetical protein [Pseudomonas sp. PA-3-5D]
MTVSTGASIAKAIGQFSDPYERQARLYPALLTLSPVIVLVFSLYSEKLGVLSTLVSALIVCGLLYLLADFARRGGKAKEPALWKKWGGMPSTQVLRHRENTTFDVASLQRYHAILAKKMGARFPNAGEEAADPQAADALYTSAGNMLRNATRDTKQFGLLYKDNISYGFRRNAFGLRCVAISLCLGSLVWVGVRHGLNSWVIRFQAAATPESLLNGGELTSVAVSLAMLFLWLRYFTEQSVREAAFSYARTLVLTCEAWAPKPRAARATAEKSA